jgi:hypothetical protein
MILDLGTGGSQQLLIDRDGVRDFRVSAVCFLGWSD